MVTFLMHANCCSSKVLLRLNGATHYHSSLANKKIGRKVCKTALHRNSAVALTFFAKFSFFIRTSSSLSFSTIHFRDCNLPFYKNAEKRRYCLTFATLLTVNWIMNKAYIHWPYLKNTANFNSNFVKYGLHNQMKSKFSPCVWYNFFPNRL